MEAFNLDDEMEVLEFIDQFGTTKGTALANAIGITGKGKAKRANDLSAYAWNKKTAMECRERGDIKAALIYENICDRVYSGMNESDKW